MARTRRVGEPVGDALDSAARPDLDSLAALLVGPAAFQALAHEPRVKGRRFELLPGLELEGRCRPGWVKTKRL